MVETVTFIGHPSSGTVRVCVYAHACDGCAFDVVYLHVLFICSTYV